VDADRYKDQAQAATAGGHTLVRRSVNPVVKVALRPRRRQPGPLRGEVRLTTIYRDLPEFTGSSSQPILTLS
jgi:hypothetical protein